MTNPRWVVDGQRQETDPDKRWLQSYLPDKYRDLTWDDYQDTAGNNVESLKDILIDYAEGWEPDERMGVVVLGHPGFGKTMGMSLMGKHLTLERQVYVKYTTYADIVEWRKELIKLERDGDRTGDYEAHNRLVIKLALVEQECDVLLLDDVGKEYRAASGWSDDGLDLLLRRREAAGKVTCIASNLLMQDWTNYNMSMASFLYEVGEVVLLTRGRDHRVRKAPAAKRREARRGGR